VTRRLAVNIVLAVLCFAAALGGVMVGDFGLSVQDVAAALAGQSTDLTRTVVVEWRLPRVVTALAVGAALGFAGAIFQTITRNPLASPDILGVTSGASAFALTALLAGGSSGLLLSSLGVPLSAFIGGVAVSGAILWLSRGGGLESFQLIFAGIIINALAVAYNSFLLVRADYRDAGKAQAWVTGSVGSSGWNNAAAVLIALALVVPLIRWAEFQLEALSLGEDTAAGLGVDPRSTQLGLMMAAVALTATAVAASGPISFVAFVAPQVGRRLAHAPTPPLGTAMLTGAFIVSGADLVVRTLVPGNLPVGVATSAIGGAALLYALMRATRKVTL